MCFKAQCSEAFFQNRKKQTPIFGETKKKKFLLKFFFNRMKIKINSICRRWVYFFFKDSRKASSDLTLRRRFFTKELHIKQSSLTLELSSFANWPIGSNDRKIPFLLDDLSTLTLRNSPVMPLFSKIRPRK
jgi:hypothetical protein